MPLVLALLLPKKNVLPVLGGGLLLWFLISNGAILLIMDYELQIDNHFLCMTAAVPSMWAPEAM